jgi:hypothetical protein
MGLLGTSKWGPGGANNDDDFTPPPDAPKGSRNSRPQKEDRAPRGKKGKVARNERAAGNERPGVLGNGIDHGYGNSGAAQGVRSEVKVGRSPYERMASDQAAQRFDNNSRRDGYGDPRDTHGFDNNNGQHAYGHPQRLDTNTGYGNSNFVRSENAQRQDSTAGPKPLAEHIMRDAPPQNTLRFDTNPHHSYNTSPTPRTLPSDTPHIQDSSDQPPPTKSAFERAARNAPRQTTQHSDTNPRAHRGYAPSIIFPNPQQPPHAAFVEDENAGANPFTFSAERKKPSASSSRPSEPESMFAVQPATVSGPKISVKRPAVRVVGPASTQIPSTADHVKRTQPTSVTSSTAEKVKPAQPAATSSTPIVTTTPTTSTPTPTVTAETETFNIPPQPPTLSDTDYFFLIGKLRGRTVNQEEWDSAVEMVGGIGFVSTSTSSNFSTKTTMAEGNKGEEKVDVKENVEVAETKGKDVIGEKDKRKAKAESRLSDEFRRLMSKEGEEDEL